MNIYKSPQNYNSNQYYFIRKARVLFHFFLLMNFFYLRDNIIFQNCFDYYPFFYSYNYRENIVSKSQSMLKLGPHTLQSICFHFIKIALNHFYFIYIIIQFLIYEKINLSRIALTILILFFIALKNNMKFYNGIFSHI